VEAAIDFPEEEIDFIADGQVKEQLQGIIEQLHAVQASARQGSLMREGMKLVIAGRPNAGKSSLLNQLAGEEKAIVTPIEGTTRDILREHIQIDGMPLHIVDTAGLRDSDDTVEQEGIRRAWQEIASADRILLIADDSGDAQADILALQQQLSSTETQHIAVTVVRNKCDVSGRQPAVENDGDCTTLRMSAKTGDGLELLKHHLKQCMGYDSHSESQFSARRRHLLALQAAMDALLAGEQQLLNAGAGELLAEDLRLCQHHLGEITGAVSSDELLGHIFSSFCIGK
jgi:tRNA modification GTPase